MMLGSRFVVAIATVSSIFFFFSRIGLAEDFFVVDALDLEKVLSRISEKKEPFNRVVFTGDVEIHHKDGFKVVFPNGGEKEGGQTYSANLLMEGKGFTLDGGNPNEQFMVVFQGGCTNIRDLGFKQGSCVVEKGTKFVGERVLFDTRAKEEQRSAPRGTRWKKEEGSLFDVGENSKLPIHGPLWISGSVDGVKGGDVTLIDPIFDADSLLDQETKEQREREQAKEQNGIYLRTGGELTFDINDRKVVKIPVPILGNQGQALFPGDSTCSLDQGKLKKKGKGTLVLCGKHSYSGEATFIEDGTLRLENGDAEMALLMTPIVNNGHLDIPDRAKIVFSLTPENLRYARSDKTDSRPLMTLLQKAGSKVTIGSTNRSAREGNRSLLQIQDGYYQEKDAELEVVLHPNRKRNQPFIELTEEGGILSGKLLINAQGSNYIAGDEYTIVVSNLTCVDAENLQEVKVVGDLAGKLNVEVVEQDLSNPKELKIRVKETMLFDEIKEEGNEEEGYFDYLRSLPIQSQTPIADFLSDIGSVYSSSDMVQIVPRLLPSLYTSLSWMSLDTGRTVLDGIELFSNCLYEGGCKGKEQDGRFWSQASSWLTDYDPLQSMLGFRSTNGTFSLGYEHCIVSGLVLGFFGSYTHNYVNWKEHFGKGNLNTLQFGLYANYCREHVYANAAIGSGVSFYDMHRFTKVNGASGTLEDVGVEATFQGIPALAQIKIGGKGEIGPSLVLSPELLVSYHFLYRGSFREEGPVCTVWQLSSMHSHMLHGDLGLVLSKSVNVKQVRFLLFSGISYVANLPLGSGSYRASLADFSEQMTFTSPNRVRSRVAPKVGLKGVSLANGVSFELRYQGQFGSGQDYHNATAVLEAQF